MIIMNSKFTLIVFRLGTLFHHHLALLSSSFASQSSYQRVFISSHPLSFHSTYSSFIIFPQMKMMMTMMVVVVVMMKINQHLCEWFIRTSSLHSILAQPLHQLKLTVLISCLIYLAAQRHGLSLDTEFYGNETRRRWKAFYHGIIC